jgi:hypothetical protein
MQPSEDRSLSSRARHIMTEAHTPLQCSVLTLLTRRPSWPRKDMDHTLIMSSCRRRPYGSTLGLAQHVTRTKGVSVWVQSFAQSLRWTNEDEPGEVATAGGNE